MSTIRHKPGNRWNATALAEVKRLFHSGQTYQQVADTMGVTKNAITGVIARMRKCGFIAGPQAREQSVKTCLKPAFSRRRLQKERDQTRPGEDLFDESRKLRRATVAACDLLLADLRLHFPGAHYPSILNPSSGIPGAPISRPLLLSAVGSPAALCVEGF